MRVSSGLGSTEDLKRAWMVQRDAAVGTVSPFVNHVSILSYAKGQLLSMGYHMRNVAVI